MRKLLLLLLGSVVSTVVCAQTSAYSYSVPKIEGGIQSLSAWQGKKLLIITLPILQSASADSLLYSLDTLATNHSSTLKVIAVPSYEDGFTVAQRATLNNWYRSKLKYNIVITDGLKSRKTSGVQQHGLMKWLTTILLNENFDSDITGPGDKFFITGNGELVGMLPDKSKMWGASVQRALQL